MTNPDSVGLARGLAGDFGCFRHTYHPHRPAWVAAFAFCVQPSTSVLWLFRGAASRRKVISLLFRRRLVRRFGCDVESGAKFCPGLLIGHPVGIVIGGGVVVGERVKLHQNVTLGIHRGGCPTLEPDVYVFPGAVVVGPIVVGRGAIIGANAYVDVDVPPRVTVAGGTRWTKATTTA